MSENGKPNRVLLVEDDKFMVKVYEVRLKAEGFDVEVVANGDECLEKVFHFPPDIILLDLMLPLMDGFTVLETLKANEQTAEIPVIVFSNRSNPEDISRVMQLGAVDFLVKVSTPPEEVIHKIHNALEKKADSDKLLNHYYLSIDWDALDARQLAEELGVPVEYQGGRCITDVILDAIPEYSHDEPWIMGRFVIREKPKD